MREINYIVQSHFSNDLIVCRLDSSSIYEIEGFTQDEQKKKLEWRKEVERRF